MTVVGSGSWHVVVYLFLCISWEWIVALGAWVGRDVVTGALSSDREAVMRVPGVGIVVALMCTGRASIS